MSASSYKFNSKTILLYPGRGRLNILELLLVQSLTDQCLYVDNKSTKCLNHLCRAMFGCTQEAKANAYRVLVRPCLEYACAVWTPYTTHGINLLESVKHIAAHWIKSYWDPSALKWSKSSTICAKELN